MKFKTILMLTPILLSAGCRGLYMPDYNRQAAVHQDIEAASELKLGLSMDEVKKTMGVKPVRIDTEGDTVVWQYCNTERIRSKFVALSFSAKFNSLQRKNSYTIFWDETKGKVVTHGDVVVRPSTYQLSCDYVAQKMGVKDPKNVEIWFTSQDALNHKAEIRLNEMQSQQGSGYDNSQDARRQEEQRMRQREQYNRVNGFR